MNAAPLPAPRDQVAELLANYQKLSLWHRRLLLKLSRILLTRIPRKS